MRLLKLIYRLESKQGNVTIKMINILKNEDSENLNYLGMSDPNSRAERSVSGGENKI